MPSTDKVLGYGTLVKADPAGGSTFVSVGSLKNTNPPEQSRKAADGTSLDDAREVMDPGLTEATPFEFTQFFRPGDTNQIIIDTLFTSKAVATWQVVYPQDTPVTEAFSGWVQKVGRTVSGNNEYSMRKVVVMTTTASTLT